MKKIFKFKAEPFTRRYYDVTGYGFLCQEAMKHFNPKNKKTFWVKVSDCPFKSSYNTNINGVGEILINGFRHYLSKDLRLSLMNGSRGSYVGDISFKFCFSKPSWEVDKSKKKR